MDKRKRSTAEAHLPELPTDITFLHILPRLPLKSVSRFKLVSKQWHSFLTTPAFEKMHLHHANTNKVVFLSTTTPFKFQTLDCERPQDGFTAGRSLPFKVGLRQSIRIITSGHGMVCIGIAKDPHKEIYSDLILWNPTTGQHKTLSKPFLVIRSHRDCYSIDESLFGLYHTSWDDDYKLLRVTRRPTVYIYSLKSDSWRKVESDLQRIRVNVMLSYSWVPSVSLNENLYFLEYSIRNSYSIMRFNTKTETLKLIPTPFLENQKTSWLSFTVLRDGCIHLWVNIENSKTLWSENELWRMDGDGDGDWTKVLNSGPILSDNIPFQRPLHLMRNGNILIFRESCVYELDMNTHTKVLWAHDNNKEMRVWPEGKYIEGTVSPNQYTK